MRLLAILFVLFTASAIQAEQWLVTAYCSCKICCGKEPNDPAYSITASGKKAVEGRTCAVNWLPFGTRLNIKGLGERVVEDRGAKSLFGDKDNHIKHVDVFFAEHSTAKRFGKRHLSVTIKKESVCRKLNTKLLKFIAGSSRTNKRLYLSRGSLKVKNVQGKSI